MARDADLTRNILGLSYSSGSFEDFRLQENGATARKRGRTPGLVQFRLRLGHVSVLALVLLCNASHSTFANLAVVADRVNDADRTTVAE